MKVLLELLECPTHKFRAIAIGANAGTSTRITGSKCCGRWTTAQSWRIDADDAIRVLEDAREDAEKRAESEGGDE
jgi:hypothetical protein